MQEDLAAGRRWCRAPGQDAAVGGRSRLLLPAALPGGTRSASAGARSTPEPAGRAPQPVIRAEHPPAGCPPDPLTHGGDARGAGAHHSCCACCARQPGPSPLLLPAGCPTPLGDAPRPPLPCSSWEMECKSCFRLSGLRRSPTPPCGAVGEVWRAGAAGAAGSIPGMRRSPFPGMLGSSAAAAVPALPPGCHRSRIPSHRAATAPGPGTARPRPAFEWQMVRASTTE